MSPLLANSFVGSMEFSKDKVFLNTVFRKCKSVAFEPVHLHIGSFPCKR